MGEQGTGSPQDHVVCCWGCSRLILAPYTEQDRLAELFKCGWCEAINSLQQQPLVSPHQQSQQSGSSQLQLQLQQQPCDYYTQQQHQWQQQQHLQPGVWQGGSRGWPAAAAAQAPASNSQQAHNSGRGWGGRLTRAWATCVWALRWCAVAMVIVLISSLAGCGIHTLLPLLCTTWLTYIPNLFIAVLLLLEVCFNYAAAVMQHAGRVSDHSSPPIRTPDGSVPQSSLQHWSWCMHCQAAKPPQVHHCRTCRCCVVNMDHHCTMLNNCVGAGNLRPFLLFLMWTLAAAAYMLCMCSLLVWQHRQEVMAAIAAGWGGPVMQQGGSTVRPGSTNISRSSSAAGWDGDAQPTRGMATAAAELWVFAAAGVFVLVLQESPWWMLAAYYLVAVSLGVLISLGLLLGSQLYYLGLGVSYVDQLKAGPQAAQPPGQHPRPRWVWRVLCEVLGVPQLGGLLQAVIVPHWRVPAVSSAAAAAKKWR